MFMKDAVEIACPDSAAGLYVRTRSDQIVKVHFLIHEILAIKDLNYFMELESNWIDIIALL